MRQERRAGSTAASANRRLWETTTKEITAGGSRQGARGRLQEQGPRAFRVALAFRGAGRTALIHGDTVADRLFSTNGLT